MFNLLHLYKELNGLLEYIVPNGEMMNSVKDVHLNAKQWDELICDSGIKKDACDKKADPKYPPRINTPPLPEGMKPPAHQVTGHIYGKGKTKLGFLECTDGTIIKPCQLPPRGTREMHFYQTVFNPESNEPELIRLRKLLPEYLGMVDVKEHPDTKYIRLENLVTKISHPCVMDIKMGSKSYDPNATAEKIKREMSRYPPQIKMGFRMAGMRVYDIDSLSYITTDKQLMMRITPEQFLTQSLNDFFIPAKYMNACILTSFLRKLLKIQQWFTNQKCFEFYSSSLFFIYESDLLKYPSEPCILCTKIANQCRVLTESCSGKIVSDSKENGEKVDCENNTDIKNLHGYNELSFVDTLPVKRICDLHLLFENEASCICNVCDRLTDVRMIDFAHVFTCSDVDNHYLHGLNNLIAYFMQLLLSI